MNLIELPKSPYWGVNVHVGYYPDGKRRYSPRSTKVRRDPGRVDGNGQRLDKLEAMRVATALQQIANEAMADESAVVERERVQEMVESLLRVMGKTLRSRAPSWAVFAKEVIDRHGGDVSLASASGYKSNKRTFDKWLEGHEKLSPSSSLGDITPTDMQAFYDSLIEDGRRPTTATKIIKSISFVFSAAVAAEHIDRNPCAGVKRRRSKSKTKQPFSVSDLAKIVKAVEENRDKIEFADEWGLAIKFAIFTGARLSDCIKLRAGDFSDGFRRVRFVPKKKERLHNLGEVDASVSMILPEFLAPEFARAAESDSGHLTPNLLTPNLLALRPGKNGHGSRFRAILDLAGIEYETIPPKDGKGITWRSRGFHSFRSTLKTELRAGGVSMETSNYVTGHDDEKVAMRYVHEKAETIFRECSPVFEEFRTAIDGA